jgi:type II secretory pathway pseudopilin PulG
MRLPCRFAREHALANDSGRLPCRFSRAGRSLHRARGMTAVEVAVTFAVVGSLLAVAVPAFVRNLHASKLVEPVDGVTAIAEGATTYAKAHDVPHAYPPSAPLTPAVVPHGTREVDPVGAWDQPTWKALGFRAAEEGVPHAFAFAFESANGDARSSFTAIAHGDLDGDGVTSTFEVRGSYDQGADAGPAIEPGIVVRAEVE